MTDFVPPSGPPPPKVPEGWKAQWNDQYSEWFYVNIYTKKSQWEKPTEPVYPQSGDAPPSGPPPGYTGGSSNPFTPDVKQSSQGNPYDKPNTESDEDYARRLQAEEDARGSSSNRGAAADYMNTPVPPQQGGSPFPQPSYSPQPQSYPDQLPPREQKKGLLGKIMGKVGGSSGSHGGGFKPGGFGGGYPQHGYPQQGYPPQGYGGYPQQGYSGYPQQGYGGYGGGYGGRPQKSGGGMGMAGGLALGAGAGLLGGALIADAVDDHDDYQEGYEDGMDDGGGDFGGD